MSWRGDELTIERPAAFLYPGEVSGVTLLGSDEKLTFEQTRRSLKIRSPRQKVGEHAFAFKEDRAFKRVFRVLTMASRSDRVV